MPLALNAIHCGDAFALIRELDAECADLVITSPPYYLQRGYGGGAAEIGGESSVEEYIDRLTALFRECVRVVKRTGSVVFNLGDKYENGSLLLLPYRFALKAREVEGVRLVNEVTWVKRNPTPRQFKRRLVNATEPFFHFVKSNDYAYYPDAFLADERGKARSTPTDKLGQRYMRLIEQSELSEEQKAMARESVARIVREVRDGAIQGFRMKIRGVHSEPFGGQEGGRKNQLERNGFTMIRIHGNPLKRDLIETPVESLKGSKHPAIYPAKVVEAFLSLLTKPGDLVLDPFVGSGTTAAACVRTGRRFVGFELNPDYCAEAEARIRR